MNAWGLAFRYFRFLHRTQRFAAVQVSRACSWGLLTCAAAVAEEPDFTELSLEELHAVSISAASKRSEPLFETPAAVSVLLPVNLQRAGVNAVADSLRLVPGAHVIDQLPQRWSIGIRGGNGLQSTKLLVLVDGRSVYGPYYGGVEWGNAHVDVADLARVEVVRGPGATLWGANAVNGVVNVISKDARETQGSLIAIRGGTGEPGSVHARYGGRAGDHTWFRVYTSARSTETALGSLEDDPQAGYNDERVGVRTDSSLTPDVHLTTQAERLKSSRSTVGDASTHELSSLLSRLSIREIAAGDLQVQLYFDRTRDRTGAADGGGSQSLPFALESDTDNFDVDLTHSLHTTGRHTVIWGGGARFTDDTVRSSDSMQVAEPESESWLFNFFLQDEFAVTERLKLTAGAKFEHHETIAWEVLPNARLSWLPNERHFFWLALSRAARAPSRSEREVRLTLAEIPASPVSPPVRVEVAGNPNYGAEINNAYEAGWRWKPTARFQTDTTVFLFNYAKVRSLQSTMFFEPGPPLTVIQRYDLENAGSARTWGAEATWQYSISDDWQLGGGASAARATTENIGSNPLVEADYAIPSWMWHLRSWWQLPRDFEFSTTVYGVHDIKRSQTDGYVRLDVQLLWRARADMEFSLGVQNATDPRHPEGTTGDLLPNVEVRRNVYARIQWRF